MKLTGAEIIIKCLLEQEVDTVFGYPGGAVLNIYDALFKNSDKIKHILTSHEQGAAHAADGYARTTGKVGVCIATSGPGATNLVTGIATAYMDSVPMVAITGQVATSLLGKDSFQEVDITGITMPITKYNCIVKDVNKLAETIRKAFKIASSGRPGPVLIDVCKDVTAVTTDYEVNESDYIEDYFENFKCSKEEIKEVADIINKAKKPFMIVGGGVAIAKANKLVLELAQRSKIPTTTTLMGLGAFPGNHEYYTGLLGMHGSKTSNLACTESDLLIAIGARFSDRVIGDVKKFANNAKIVHIDIDPAEVGKNVVVDYSLTGEINSTLSTLLEHVSEKDNKEWLLQIKKWNEDFPVAQKKDDVLRPQFIVEKINELTNSDATIVSEVGQNQLWAAQFYKFKNPRQFLTSGGLGTMGYGFGAAIGAQVGRPDQTVINIAGDGSFRMNLNELATAVRYKLPLVIAILNNGVLGMVRQWQTLFYEQRYSATTVGDNTDFVKFAESFGAKGIRVTKNEEVEDAIKSALSEKNGPVVIDFHIDKDEMVLPIVPPGKSLTEIID